MKTILVFFFVIAVSLIIIFSSSNAYADYEESGFRLTHSPTIYAVSPEPDPTIPNLDGELFQKTQSAILDWKNQLNLGGERKPVWDMNLVEISSSELNSDPSKLSQADIQIFYLPSPTSTPDVEEPVGVTTYDVINHKAKIIIYYKKLTFNIVTTETRDSKYIYYHHTPVPTYWEQLASDTQLSMTIEHELGHAFGLGHYKISQDEADAIVSGKETELPSIMTPIVVPIGTNHYSITISDIQQLKSLYSPSGFSSPKISMSIDTTNTCDNQLIGDLRNNYYWEYNSDILGVLGCFSYENLLPQSYSTWAGAQITYPSWFMKDVKMWANHDISDNDFALTIKYLHEKGLINWHY